jgi:hypothetical protein
VGISAPVQINRILGLSHAVLRLNMCRRCVFADDPPAVDRQFQRSDTGGVDLHANLPSVNNARDPAQDRETNVDQEVSVAPGLEEDRERRL